MAHRSLLFASASVARWSPGSNEVGAFSFLRRGSWLAESVMVLGQLSVVALIICLAVRPRARANNSVRRGRSVGGTPEPRATAAEPADVERP